VNRISGILAVFLGSLAIAASAAGGYRLLKTIAVSGDEGWDYCVVDAAGRRLYVSHSSHVVVMDPDSGAIVGKIDNTDGVHGIAIAADLGRGFTSNGRAATSTIFDLKTLKTIGEVKVGGENPDAIVYDPATKRVFTFNKRSENSTAIDAREGKALRTFDLGGNPEFAVSDAKGHVFVDLVNKDTVLQIDSKTLSPGQRWTTGSCHGPGTMAIDRKNSRLFVGCRNKTMAILDATNGRLITTVPIGAGRDAAAFDPATKLIFSANGEGNVTVIHEESPDKYTVVETVQTANGARTMALDEKTHKIYFPVADRAAAPAPTKDNPNPRGDLIPGSFRVLIFGM
jgi:DNA-binding beta-propeller fold protein YncE